MWILLSRFINARSQNPQFKVPFIFAGSSSKKFRVKVARRKYSKSFLSRRGLLFSIPSSIERYFKDGKKAEKSKGGRFSLWQVVSVRTYSGKTDFRFVVIGETEIEYLSRTMRCKLL